MYGLALRHTYLYTGSWPRLLQMMYWPVLNIVMYGFVSLSIIRHFSNATIMTNAYLGGLMLVEILTRVVMAMMVGYMEEVWSRNLGQLFASPLRLRDFVAGLISLGTCDCLLAVIPAFVVVYYLFGFSILQLGWHLPLYVGLLCFNGWWYGLIVVSLLTRLGQAAEWLGWMSIYLLLPFMAPYYPVAILPKAFQAIAWCLPGTYVFESMKSQVATGLARGDYLWVALALNLLYFVGATVVFRGAYRSARNSGGLLQMGE
jgi:ABC-2 type transport system permease protein